MIGHTTARVGSLGGNRELSSEPAFSNRIRRLSATSAVALGITWLLWIETVSAPRALTFMLLAGWIAMPVVLIGSLRAPAVRWLLVVPSTLVGVPVLAAATGAVTVEPAAQGGWILVAVGIVLGALLGIWFWFRLLPVPVELDDPFSRGRWMLIAVHVATIASGLVWIALARFLSR
jgi:hypothetical protein